MPKRPPAIDKKGIVYDGTLPKGEPFVCPDGRKICGAKSKSRVSAKGEPLRCTAIPSKNGRCYHHGSSANNPGRPCITAERSEARKAWLGRVAELEIGDLLSGKDDLELFKLWCASLELQLGEASAANDTALIEKLEEKLAVRTDQLDRLRRSENRREERQRETMTMREALADQAAIFTAVDEVLSEIAQRVQRVLDELARRQPDNPKIEFRVDDLYRLVWLKLAPKTAGAHPPVLAQNAGS